MKKKQPNILVICSDEHHPLMSSYRGHPYVKTPNLDRLAQRGTAFTRAYCNSPVCTPSRMSFITGKYIHQIDNWFIGVPLSRDEMTWARRLEQAGIPSTMLGKMDFCGEYQDGGFEEYRIIRKRPAFSTYPREAPLLSRLSGYVRPDKREHIVRSGIRQDVVTDGSNGNVDGFGFYDHDRIVTEWAIDYLKEKSKKEDDSPWALYVGLIFPHWPFTVPKKYFDMYYPDKIAMPHDFCIPTNSNLHPELLHFQKAQNLTDLTEDDIRRTIASYYGMITCMDEMIGLILDQLEIGGMLEDTYIIYTSDHGDSLGEHGLFYKQCSYEGSVGVPLILAGPDIPQGKEVAAPVSLVDMYPTIMDFANLETEKDHPGKSWKRIAMGEETSEVVFSEYHGNFFRKDWYMITDSRYKFTYYVGDRSSLFDLVLDPLELHDLALVPEYQPLLQKYEACLRKIVNPEEVAMRAKHDLGLISPEGEDYTETLTVQKALEYEKIGKFKFLLE